MFTDELEAIRVLLESNEPFSRTSFVVNPFKESSTGFKGISDEYGAYAYVQQIEDRDGRTYRFEQAGKSCESYIVYTTAKVIAGFKCIDPTNAALVLSNQIAGATARVIDVSTNPYLIYENETGEPLKRDDIKMVRITFELSKFVQLNGCETLTCIEGCC